MTGQQRAGVKSGRRMLLGLVLTGVLMAAACSTTPSASGAPRLRGHLDVSVTNPDRCDPIGVRACLLPFPSDTFTVPDPSSPTGRRVHLEAASMPVNKSGIHIDPTPWNQSDGFSPGEPITVLFPGLDPAATGLADAGNIGASLAADAPVVLVDATTHRRWPYWTELDATAASDADRVLFIRPAVNFPEGHRMVVALRRLRDRAGATLPVPEVFRAYRDRLQTNVAAVESSRGRYEKVFSDLAAAGVQRSSLVLAWDFTVASAQGLAGPLLSMRDDAFRRLGAAAPAFRVTKVEPGTAGTARRVTGTFDVPLYLTGDGSPGSRLSGGLTGGRSPTGSYRATFRCVIPTVALTQPGRPGVYGHGLLGSATEVNAGNVQAMASEHDFVFCATNWIGFSSEDVPTVVQDLNDLSLFPQLSDRALQGILNTLFLGRLMIHAQGLISDPAFQSGGRPVIDTSALFYDGNSQGAVMGGAATAVSTDWRRAVLGVAGMNYSTLLQRSSDWTPFSAIFTPAYPDPVDRVLGISLVQMLWDRVETDGYAEHLTDHPLPGTPAHTVLLDIALGDHQVSNTAAEVEARTIGAQLRWPATAPGRLPDRDPHWGLTHLVASPAQGSVLVWWDSGSPAAPLVNLAPVAGHDPHEDPRNDPAARQQKSEFLSVSGRFVDVCPGHPCTDQPAG